MAVDSMQARSKIQRAVEAGVAREDFRDQPMADSQPPLARSGARSGADFELVKLLRRIAQEDGQALAEFYDHTSSWIFGLVRRILADPQAAEEVTLDVYLQVWKSAAAFQSERGSVFAWLVSIARSRALDRRRAQSREARRLAAIEATAFEDLKPRGPVQKDPLLVQELQGQVRSALQRLPESQKEAIHLAFFAGLTHDEIAQRLKQPLGTVKTQIRLGVLKLRRILHPVGAQQQE